MISKTKIALLGAVLLIAGAGIGVTAQAAPAALTGASTDVSAQSNTTRVRRARPKKQRTQRTNPNRRTPRAQQPRSTNQ